MALDSGTVKWKIMMVCVLSGCYPYSSFDLIDTSIANVYKAIAELKELGFISISDQGKIKAIKKQKVKEKSKDVDNSKMYRLLKQLNGKGIISLSDVEFRKLKGLMNETDLSENKIIKPRMFDKLKLNYLELFDGLENYKLNHIGNHVKDVERRLRISEILMMMIEAGVNISPDKKPFMNGLLYPELNKTLLPYFMTSLEVRSVMEINEDKGKGARFHGTLVSSGGIYNVYNMGETMMDWVRPSEYAASEFINRYSKRIMPEFCVNKGWYQESAIVLSRRYDYITEFVNGNIHKKNGSGSSKNLVNINEYYKHTFYLPLSIEGQVMINMMTLNKWHYYLVGLFYPRENTEMVTPQVEMSIACDAIKDGCYSLVFMDGDIGRLKRFASIDVKDEDYGKYKVICYTFQEPHVKKVLPPGMEVVSYDFAIVTEKFYEVYDKYEMEK